VHRRWWPSSLCYVLAPTEKAVRRTLLRDSVNASSPFCAWQTLHSEGRTIPDISSNCCYKHYRSKVGAGRAVSPSIKPAAVDSSGTASARKGALDKEDRPSGTNISHKILATRYQPQVLRSRVLSKGTIHCNYYAGPCGVVSR